MPQNSNQYGAIVVGVGGVGSAITYQLARRGVDVLGLEQHGIPHEKGSSHGHTRIIRLAYHEDPSYVALLRRAYDLWEQIESEYGEPIIYKTGSVSAGPPSSELVTGAIEACEEHSIPYEELSGDALSKRFSGFDLPAEFRAVYQSDGGFVRPEKSITAHVEQAHANGAEIHGRERVKGWQSTTDGVRVSTDNDQYTADRLVIAAGAWTGQLLDLIAPSLSPERQVLAWLQPKEPDQFSLDSFPVYGIASEDTLHYGTPVFNVPGVKVGRHHHFGEDIDPDEMDHEPTDRDEEALRSFVERYLPDGAGPTMKLQTCLYTNTPDRHFIIDTLPGHSDVVVASGFSGHGFKFASVVGEVAAELAIEGESTHDIDLFGIDRLSTT